MKTAKEWLDENGYKNTEMWSRQGVYEVAIRLQHDHDNELISEIEKKMPKEYTSKYVDEHWANAEVMQALAVRGALTEIINLIKEK